MKESEQMRQTAEYYKQAMERISACRKQLNEIIEMNRMYKMQIKIIGDECKRAQDCALNRQKPNFSDA